MYHANVNVNLIQENVVQIKSGKNVKKDYIWNPATYSCKNRKIFSKYY